MLEGVVEVFCTSRVCTDSLCASCLAKQTGRVGQPYFRSLVLKGARMSRLDVLVAVWNTPFRTGTIPGALFGEGTTMHVASSCEIVYPLCDRKRARSFFWIQSQQVYS